MADRVAMLFPGQGSQKAGMGKPFVDEPEFSIARKAQEILNIDVEKLLCDESEDSLTNTHDSQLAILLTSLMSFERSKAQDYEIVCFAGHSLGQVSALICADVISLEEGINFASKRAIETQKCADKNGGAMAALLGADKTASRLICETYPELWVANDNAPGQIVIAGNESSIDKVVENARDFELKKAIKLGVNGAFHTPYMNEASLALEPVLETMTFSKPIAPVASNDDGRAYSTFEIWQKKLSAHVSNPVLWVDCMDAVVLLEPQYGLEIGFGSTLAGLAKRCTPDFKVQSFYTEVK
ncbi:MAG: ACP S-malonyltransferase [Acidimicrobiia bacterium]